ncbi:MAG: FliG C-terminal domain-containing protein [bacterium]
MKKFLLPAFIPILSILSAGPVSHAAQSTPKTLEAKLALESSLEKRVRTVISEALGTDDIIIIISAKLKEEESGPQPELMPGVPAKDTLGEPSLASSLTMVKSINATMILDKTLPQEDVDLARKLAAGLLGIPADREDLITVEKMSFRKARNFSAADLLRPPDLWNLLWLVCAAAVLVVLVRIFFSPFSASLAGLVEVLRARNAAGGGTERTEDELSPEIARASKTETAESETSISKTGEKPPFWFLEERHIPNLAFLLEKMPFQATAVILNYAPKPVAAKLIDILYPKSVQALSHLSKVAEIPEDKVREFEKNILSKLDYVIGGEDKMTGILEMAPEKVQDEVISIVREYDETSAERISGLIVRFSDLAYLEPAHAQMLARRVPMRIFARALKSADFSEKFTGRLPSGMQERLRQEMDMTVNVTENAVKTDRKRVAEVLKQLVKEGFVTLKTQTASVPPAPEDNSGNVPPAPPPAQPESAQKETGNA